MLLCLDKKCVNEKGRVWHMSKTNITQTLQPVCHWRQGWRCRGWKEATKNAQKHFLFVWRWQSSSLSLPATWQISAATEINRNNCYLSLCNLMWGCPWSKYYVLLCCMCTPNSIMENHVALCKVHTLSFKIQAYPHSSYILILALTFCTLRSLKKEHLIQWVGPRG